MNLFGTASEAVIYGIDVLVIIAVSAAIVMSWGK